jgi:prolyl oligopeptidase
LPTVSKLLAAATGCALMCASFLASTVSAVTSAPDGQPKSQTGPIEYPPAARGDHVDVYHGVKVPDPYRWMEDIDSPQTRAWVEAEAKLSSAYLSRIPGRDRIAAQLKKIWNYERWTPPEKHGATWFFTHNDGLQNQPVIFATPDPGAHGPARTLLDPNTLSRDGTVALRERAISQDGKYFAYALSEAGSDWQTWRVKDVATGKDLPDELHWSKAGGGSWRKDNSGFYYTIYDEPKSGEALKAANQFEKLRFHKLGTPQSRDPLIYTRTDDPDWFVGGIVTDDGRYLVIQANHGDEVQNTVLVQDLSKPGAAIQPIIEKPTAVYNVVGNIGATLYVQTDDGAPRYRIIAIDVAKPARENWRTVVPESTDTLDSVSLVGGQLIASYLKDAHSAVRRYSTDGKLVGEVQLEGLGTASGFAGRLEDRETFYSYSSFTTPPSVYHLDIVSGKSALWRQPKLEGFNPAEYATTQVFYTSKDGTHVPMFVVARKGVKLDGNNPTILYGYGGFNISEEPGFSPSVAGWLQLGGVFALANIRGGGEYGRAWHEAGMKVHKQNVFDDFAAAAQYLIAQKWTRPQRLAIRGGSNGGLLVGATIEQHPELFAAAIAQVGVMDMLRFRDFTVGKGWESDYGSVDNPDEFHALLAYSPLQNVKPNVNYPSVLVTTGDHDDRVFPAHSFKFTAAMQHADPHGNPILIRIETRAGHGQGKPTAKQIDEMADIYAFTLNAMGLAG